MGSYDGAEICELVGLFILNHLGNSFGKENIGLYRDDGLAIIKNKSGRLADKTRKELHKAFEQFGLKIILGLSGIKFTRGKLSRCYFRPFHREIQTLQEAQ